MPEGPDYLDRAMEALSAAVIASDPELGKNFCQLAAAYITLARFHQRSIERHYAKVEGVPDPSAAQAAGFAPMQADDQLP
jgi:hypothetical protein